MSKVFIGRLKSVSFNFDKNTVELIDMGGNKETHSASLTSTDAKDGELPPNRPQETLRSYDLASTRGTSTITANYKDGTITTATWKS